MRLQIIHLDFPKHALRRASALGAGETVRELIEQALALEPPRAASAA
jgi:hypothetical protein